MLSWICCLVMICIIGENVGMRGPHHPRDDHYHYVPGKTSPKLTQDENLLHDKDHIQEDLENILPEGSTKHMTPEELEFHYFKVHDFDNNTKLDGLEILQAIRHTIEHEEHKIKDNTNPDSKIDFEYFVELIDRVLEEDDTDNDGYLSYIEYVIGRQRDSAKNED